jgi:F0F1-type ATP synthase assembly protein I
MVDDTPDFAGQEQGTSLAQQLNEDDAWGMVSTLVAGPVTWGLIGGGIDMLVGTHRVFLAVGVVVGFITSLVIVYVRHGRS